MAARKRTFTSKATATQPGDVPAQTSPGSGPPVHSVGKTWRLRAARLCPGGNSIDAQGAAGDGCGKCPSVDECTVARFDPKA